LPIVPLALLQSRSGTANVVLESLKLIKESEDVEWAEVAGEFVAFLPKGCSDQDRAAVVDVGKEAFQLSGSWIQNPQTMPTESQDLTNPIVITAFITVMAAESHQLEEDLWRRLTTPCRLCVVGV
jgi:hypothetical protein